MLLKASACHLWVSSCHFHWDPISNYTQDTSFFLPYWYSKWDDVLQIETSIACEVFQNLSHSLDVYRRWKVLLTASIGYLWITQYHRLQRLALKLHKSGSFEDRSVHQMEWCTAMRDIHCLWSISKHFLHAQWRSNKVYKAPTMHSLIPPCSFSLMSTLKLHTKYQVLRHPLSTVSTRRCTTTRDSHCFWSIPKPSLDA